MAAGPNAPERRNHGLHSLRAHLLDIAEFKLWDAIDSLRRRQSAQERTEQAVTGSNGVDDLTVRGPHLKPPHGPAPAVIDAHAFVTIRHHEYRTKTTRDACLIRFVQLRFQRVRYGRLDEHDRERRDEISEELGPVIVEIAGIANVNRSDPVASTQRQRPVGSCLRQPIRYEDAGIAVKRLLQYRFESAIIRKFGERRSSLTGPAAARRLIRTPVERRIRALEVVHRARDMCTATSQPQEFDAETLVIGDCNIAARILACHANTTRPCATS